VSMSDWPRVAGGDHIGPSRVGDFFCGAQNVSQDSYLYHVQLCDHGELLNLSGPLFAPL
jgi:hypothetical protein